MTRATFECYDDDDDDDDPFPFYSRKTGHIWKLFSFLFGQADLREDYQRRT